MDNGSFVLLALLLSVCGAAATALVTTSPTAAIAVAFLITCVYAFIAAEEQVSGRTYDGALSAIVVLSSFVAMGYGLGLGAVSIVGWSVSVLFISSGAAFVTVFFVVIFLMSVLQPLVEGARLEGNDEEQAS